MFCSLWNGKWSNGDERSGNGISADALYNGQEGVDGNSVVGEKLIFDSSGGGVVVGGMRE